MSAGRAEQASSTTVVVLLTAHKGSVTLPKGMELATHPNGVEALASLVVYVPSVSSSGYSELSKDATEVTPFPSAAELAKNCPYSPELPAASVHGVPASTMRWVATDQGSSLQPESPPIDAVMMSLPASYARLKAAIRTSSALLPSQPKTLNAPRVTPGAAPVKLYSFG